MFYFYHSPFIKLWSCYNRNTAQVKSNPLVSLFPLTSPIHSHPTSTYHRTQEVCVNNMNIVWNVQLHTNNLYVLKLFWTRDHIYSYLNSTILGDVILDEDSSRYKIFNRHCAKSFSDMSRDFSFFFHIYNPDFASWNRPRGVFIKSIMDSVADMIL